MRTKLFVACAMASTLILFVVFSVSSTTRRQSEVGKSERAQSFENNMASLKTSNTLQKYKIEIVGSSTPRFDIELRRVIGNSHKELTNLIEVAKPLSVIIVNDSDKDIVGCSLRWEMITPQGVTQVFPQIQSTPGELMGMKPLDPEMEGRTSLISAGDVKLFAFDTNVEQLFLNLKVNSVNKQNSTFSNSFQSEDVIQAIENSKNSLFGMFSHISVSIDGIFFSDGTFVGPDSFFYFDSMRGRIAAHNELISLFSASRSSNRISEKLTNYIAQSKVRSRKSNRAETPETAYQQGYEFRIRALGEELSRRRTIHADQAIATDFLLNHDSKKVILRKVKN